MVQPEEIQLAIIIPVYKGRYLSKTLDALVRQTNKNFNLYIGDDGSPDDIEKIISPYKLQLNIIYKKFEKNIGKKSLVSHWQRCIDLSNNESWLWLLPDDDVPDDNCIESFYSDQHLNPDYYLYRFTTVHIDENDRVIRVNQIPPVIETGVDFIINKLNYIRNSSVAEYIFSRKAFEITGGFEDIPLAWGSDDLMWFKLSIPDGIYTIRKSKVSLRQSNINISSEINSLKYIKIKASYLSLLSINNQKEFRTRLDEKKQSKEFIKSCNQYIFNNYRSYQIRFNFLRILKYARYNRILIGGSYLKNIYRIILFIYKKYGK